MNAKVKKRILTALLISLIIHCGFLVWSFFVAILPSLSLPEKPEVVFHVKIDKQESQGVETLKVDTPSSHKTPKPESLLTQKQISKPSVLSEALIRKNIESSIEKYKEALKPSSFQETQILKKPDIDDVQMTKKVARALREYLIPTGDLPREAFVYGSPVLDAGEDISKNFLNKNMVSAKVFLNTPVQGINAEHEFQLMRQLSSGIEHESQSVDLGTALTYQLFKYQDPFSKERYFKLIVKVRDATLNFPVIPKELIFLVDASGSIGKTRLAQCEQGLIYSIKHLNPNDRFNIFVFNNKSIPFSPVSVKADEKHIQEALDFLQDVQSWSTTDIYQALYASIHLEHPFVPSYRIFMSDGFPTTGILDARRVINDISRINDNQVSIFTFGGGVDVDPYMLDFIAFKNRGWSTVVDREYQMGKALARLYDMIKDPLLLNVRYYVSNLNDKEIFPQTMPDFFKGSQFVIYGKYTHENRFVIQIRGNIAQEKKEFIVNAALKEALLGDKSIAHDWAFHKVYYLISQLKYRANNTLLSHRIHELSERFHIITPYSIDFQQSAQTLKSFKPKAKKIKM